MSDQTYRMLGREHQRELERHAADWRLAREARRSQTPAAAAEPNPPRERTGLLTFLVRLARVSG